MAKQVPKLPSKRAVVGTPSMGPSEVTRYISAHTTAQLWGRAAGRCEFAGCNRPLWKSSVTQEAVNLAQRAHIYSFSAIGPRGNSSVPSAELNSEANLMLVCHQCHRKIDQATDGGRYTAKLLQAMKADHESRVELVTGIAAERASHVLLYGANIGELNSHLNFNEAASAVFPERYPASDKAIELGVVNSAVTDRDTSYWETELRQLQALFGRRVSERIASKEVRHLSVFALAPQPLLMQLGALLGDIVPMNVFQRHREPSTWEWPSAAEPLDFSVGRSGAASGTPALVLGVSATVTPDRIHSVLGPDASIWTVSVPTPHNDVIKSPAHVQGFRKTLRPLLDQIKAEHGQTCLLHVFPAVPVSLAVEFGRVRMPKADMPWRIYDQVSSLGGFIPAITIS